MKLKYRTLLSLGLALSIGAAEVQAAVVAYPTKGQSEKQQSTDKAACGQWATDQTGISPEQLLQNQQAGQVPPPTTGAGRGAAGGAAAGAVGGAIAGNAGKGAAIGAGTGAVVGGVRRRKQETAAQQQQQAGQAQTQQQLASYEKAQKTCLKGKGYTVD
jgi:hypothetical protein